MKLNKRFFAVLAAVVLMFVCAVPAFAETSSNSDAENILLIAPAPTASNSDIAADAEEIVETAGKLYQLADVGESFKLMGYGMLGIFVVMVLIMVVILVLNFVTKPRKK